MMLKSRLCALMSSAAVVALLPSLAAAQTASEPAGRQDTLMPEIVVTATKSTSAQNVQDVPFAVTAFGAQQLDELHIQSVQGLSYSAPNVQIEDIGTQPGSANLSIRGLGVNSSIPSIDPTVGIFVDGIYLGVPSGALLDTFDLAGVEILRGPQGVLFGRNVTGGALVVRTTTPSATPSVDMRASIETGLSKTVTGVVTGPLVEGKVFAKMAVYFNNDDGYFTNSFTGRHDLGKNDTFVARPALRLLPTEDLEVILRFEHGTQRGDGAVASNHGLFARDSFGVSINERGYARNDWNQAIGEANLDVGFGDGRITNILGYRELKQRNFGDIDASPATLFHSRTAVNQEQLSNELRYAGTFGRLEVTTGLYLFNQDIDYYEDRTLSGGALYIAGGGFQKQQSYGVFASANLALTSTLKLNLGTRYTSEKKDVEVANIVAGGCDFVGRRCNITFRDSHKWDGFTPRVGLQYEPNEQSQYYAFYARGLRSGGYNFRNVNTAVAPGPFDQEKQDSFEIGFKRDFGDVFRLNAAGFYNKIRDVQREIQTPVPGVGTFQIITNSADAIVKGFEAEALVRLSRNLTLSGQVGYTNGKYDKVFFDLNNDRVIDARDYALELPRLAPWTYGGSLAYRSETSFGALDAVVSANHRDAAWYNDINSGLLRAATIVDANLSVTRGRVTASIYGRNLLDEATFGTEAPLPFIPGGTFSTLNKGRVFGGELRYRF